VYGIDARIDDNTLAPLHGTSVAREFENSMSRHDMLSDRRHRVVDRLPA
jgi:hypothetical protein